ncbi:MAG: hypothetical protein VX122_06525, partial [Pseudomonadota bacterium]|nr:hypothetical protein [Pseudomonadota bacterium]
MFGKFGVVVVPIGRKNGGKMGCGPQPLTALLFMFSTLIASSICQASKSAAGAGLYPVCTSCHGAAGLGNRGMSGPKLA